MLTFKHWEIRCDIIERRWYFNSAASWLLRTENFWQLKQFFTSFETTNYWGLLKGRWKIEHFIATKSQITYLRFFFKKGKCEYVSGCWRHIYHVNAYVWDLSKNFKGSNVVVINHRIQVEKKIKIFIFRSTRRLRLHRKLRRSLVIHQVTAM